MEISKVEVVRLLGTARGIPSESVTNSQAMMTPDEEEIPSVKRETSPQDVN